MYTCRFVNDNGDTFYFDYAHGVIFDLDPLGELDVNLSTSQGFQQVGELLENRSVAGVTRQLTGTLLGDATANKKLMTNTFLPFSDGTLYFNDKYFCNCVVSKTPAIGVQKKNPSFTLVLYCPSPFWYSATLSQPVMGAYVGSFQFPVCYDSHIFGVMEASAFSTIVNNGNAETAVDIVFEPEYTVSNYGVVNVNTMEMLEIHDTLTIGESTHVYRDGTTLKVEKTSNGVTTNIFSLLDEASNLFSLHPGENVLRSFADEDLNVIIRLKYYDAWVAVYDGM